MAYADQKMSGNRITVLVIVALIHIFLGYALITGLAYSAVQQVIKKVTTVDIKKDEPKKPPPPPPPPKNLPPPPVAPPVRINVAVTPPQIQTVTVAPPPQAPIVLAPPAAPPPAPPSRARGVGDVSNRKNWAAEIQDSASSELVRQGKSGVVGMAISVGPNGRPTGCSVTTSSNVSGLDALACSGIMRYARYSPALDDAGNPISATRSERIRFDFSEQEN